MFNYGNLVLSVYKRKWNILLQIPVCLQGIGIEMERYGKVIVRKAKNPACQG